MGKKQRALYDTIRILVLVGILIFSSYSCKSPTSPDGGGEADIIVYSEYDDVLDIYMDGNFQFSIGYKSSIEIDNVTLEEHELEAREISTGELIDSDTITVEEETDYTWTIDDPPDIKVTNNHGKTLKIYLDGVYQFDLVDEEDRWIIDVAYGERFLKALRASDGKEIASKTIDVDENKDYYWTID